ncbi:MAG: hypothetical protein ACR2MP_29740, partial [Streptosporangiaceae bacterium]
AGARLRAALARYLAAVVSGWASFTAAQASALASQSDATILLDAVLLGYILVAVVTPWSWRPPPGPGNSPCSGWSAPPAVRSAP